MIVLKWWRAWATSRPSRRRHRADVDPARDDGPEPLDRPVIPRQTRSRRRPAGPDDAPRRAEATTAGRRPVRRGGWSLISARRTRPAPRRTPSAASTRTARRRGIDHAAPVKDRREGEQARRRPASASRQRPFQSAGPPTPETTSAARTSARGREATRWASGEAGSKIVRQASPCQPSKVGQGFAEYQNAASETRAPRPRAAGGRGRSEARRGEDDRHRRDVNPDPVDRVAGLGESVGGRRVGAERRPDDPGVFAVDVVGEVDGVPDRRRGHDGQQDPGPDRAPSAATGPPTIRSIGHLRVSLPTRSGGLPGRRAREVYPFRGRRRQVRIGARAARSPPAAGPGADSSQNRYSLLLAGNARPAPRSCGGTAAPRRRPGRGRCPRGGSVRRPELEAVNAVVVDPAEDGDDRAPVIAASLTQVFENVYAAEEFGGRVLRARPADVAGDHQDHPRLEHPGRPEDRAGGLGGGGPPRDEELALAGRAVGVELPREEPRDVPGPFHEEPERVVLAHQPVRGHHVRAEVVAEQDHARLAGERGVEPVAPVDGEQRGDRVVGEAVEEPVAGPPADLVARQRGADRRDVPRAAEVVAP